MKPHIRTQIPVFGGALAAGLAAALLSGIAAAQPPPAAARNSGSPPAAALGSIQVHHVAGTDARWVATKLREMYAGRVEVRIDGTSSGRVVVTGPPQVQQEVSQWLAASGFLSGHEAGAGGGQASAAVEPQRIVSHAYRLTALDAKEFEAKVTRTWGAAVQASHDAIGDVATFRFPVTTAGATSVVVDRRTNTATVASPASSAASWQRVMTILDSRPKTADERTLVRPLGKADPATVRRALTLLSEALEAANKHRKQHIGQFVSLLFQPGAGGAQPGGGAQPPAPPAPPAGGELSAQAIPSIAASPASMEAIARINNVQIEILDDVVVIRGRREDVDRVAAIIEQIEQQSAQFRPEIEIYYLKHVDSAALTDMINQVYAAAYSRQGTVTVVPLQRPNAVMLIGRKENIPALIELIAKLDQPAPTEGEFKIFKLQHMSAIDAERTIRNFFVNRPPTDTTVRTGMGTRALVIADFRTNSLIVQAAPRDMLEIVKLIESLDVPSAAATQEVRIFKLRNAIAATLAPILQEAITGATAGTTAQTVANNAGQSTPARAIPPAVSLSFQRIGPGGIELIKSGIMSTVTVSADAQSNTLIVTGPSTAMDLMAALIEQLDSLPPSEAQIKVFTIRNGDATALAEMLQNLFGVAQAGQAGAVPGQGTATGAGDSAIVPLRFSVDQRTNSIIASGNAGDLNVIYHILVRLDEGDIRTRRTSVYRLRNAPAADVANALTQLLQQQLTLIQIAPELVTPVEQIDQQVIVVPEGVTNSIIVSATERRFAEINKMIETLDRRPPMVVIQVVIAEVTLEDNEAFGVEWGLQDALMFDRSSSATGNRFNFNSNPLTLPNDPGATSLATAGNVAGQAVSNLALGRTDQALGFGGMVLTASSESVNVLLRALERSQRVHVVSRPQVQTVDNQLAYVQVGARVPRIIGATTTTLGTVQPQITDVPVGIILQVTPRVSLDGTVAMQMYAEKSAVDTVAPGIPIAVSADGQPIESPQISITTAQTTVLARSGQTIILGGLITKTLEEETRRIPYLADIPVLGRLFRVDTARNRRTELLIIMTPFIVTSPEQIDWMNAREGARMSWCLADLINIHGPVPFGGSPLFNPSPTPLIYPDLQPGGMPLPMPGMPGAPIGPMESYPSGPPPYGTPADSTMYNNGSGESLPPSPPAPGLPSPAAPQGGYYAPPPGLISPGGSGGSALSPSQIEAAEKPVGTARWLPPAAPQPLVGPPAPLPQMLPPISPADFQQPVGGQPPVGWQQPVGAPQPAAYQQQATYQQPQRP